MLYNRDARTLEANIRRPVVEAIVTSPPYADLKDYGSGQQIGYGQKYRTEYLPALTEVFRQCYKVSRQTATMWIVVDTFKRRGRLEPLPFETVALCQEAGWTLQDIIIWDKGKTLPWSHKGRLRNVFEYILFFSKGPNHKYYPNRIAEPDDLKEWWVKYPERYALGGKNPSNIWRIGIPVQGSWSHTGLSHACPFPTELVERILLLCTDKGDVVLDPFAGSGTVVAQSLSMGRKGIGFEVNKDFVKKYRTVVLPEIKMKYRREHSSRVNLNKRRSVLGSTLRDLRVLKYGKVLFSMLCNAHPGLAKQIVALFVQREQRQIRSTDFDYVSIKWYTKKGKSAKSILQALSKLSGKPPASKFGIQSSMIARPIETVDDIWKHLGHRQLRSVFIYVDGNTHFYTSTLNEGRECLEGVFVNTKRHGRFPPILSTIGIRQDIPKTWRVPNDK